MYCQGSFFVVLYNDDKKEVTVTDYNKKSIVYKYDNNMRLDVKKVVDKNGTTSYDYDDLHRLIKKTNPDNSTIEYLGKR